MTPLVILMVWLHNYKSHTPDVELSKSDQQGFTGEKYSHYTKYLGKHDVGEY